MDNALMKKAVQYPAESRELGHIQSPNFTQNNVITADLTVFHDSPRMDFEEAEDVLDEVPQPTYDDGVRDGKAQSDLVYLNTIGVMQKALDELQEKIKEVASDIEIRHLSAVTACLKTAMPSLVASGTAGEVQKLISEVSKLSLSANLQFRAHPDGVDDCKRLCELSAANIDVTADPELEVGQVQLLWKNGGAEVNTSEVMQSFLQRLDSLLAGLEAKNTMEIE